MKKILFLFFVLVTSGCDFVKDTKVLFNDSNKLQSSIQNQYGGDSSVSFKQKNGYLVLWITVSIDSVKTRIVGDVYSQIYFEAIEAFTDTPNEIYVRIGGEVSKQ